MKKIFYFISMGLFVFTLAKAQPGKHSPEERAKKETEMMKEKLALSNDQQAKVEEINLKYAQQMKEKFRKDEEPRKDFEEMKKEMDANDAKKREELAAVLTADQLKKYDEMVAERRKERPCPPPRP